MPAHANAARSSNTSYKVRIIVLNTEPKYSIKLFIPYYTPHSLIRFLKFGKIKIKLNIKAIGSKENPQIHANIMRVNSLLEL